MQCHRTDAKHGTAAITGWSNSKQLPVLKQGWDGLPLDGCRLLPAIVFNIGHQLWCAVVLTAQISKSPYWSRCPATCHFDAVLLADQISFLHKAQSNCFKAFHSTFMCQHNQFEPRCFIQLMCVGNTGILRGNNDNNKSTAPIMACLPVGLGECSRHHTIFNSTFEEQPLLTSGSCKQQLNHCAL